MNNQQDTICAIATATGGAIGIVRVSGTDAIAISDKIFKPVGKDCCKGLYECKGNTLTFGRIKTANGEVIDEVLVSVFRAPHSYTGEDSVEISCHGSAYILKQVMQLLINEGCRAAAPGEYTQRAFLNGKMDLSQAEAVADLIASSSAATHRMAMSQMRGNFSTELSELRKQLLEITSLIELELDFSDQDVSFADRSSLLHLARKIESRIKSLAGSFSAGQAIKQGIPVAIVGKTNVGKSTLLNALLKDDKAIVSDIHGTTRDVIEDTTVINGITFRFIDTAGLRRTSDKIEQLGIERTYQKSAEAVIIVWVIDSRPSDAEISEMKSLAHGKKFILVNNKIDNPDTVPYFTEDIGQHATVSVSAKQQQGIDALEQTIYKSADVPEVSENDVIITSSRHYDALVKAHESITRVITGIESNLSGDLLSEDLRLCIHELGEITGGEITSQETLNSVFHGFCIGK